MPNDFDNLLASLRKRWNSAPSPTQSSVPSPQSSLPSRWQDDLIEQLIPESASVLDLGCGRGQLLARLVARKHVRGQGIEVDPEMVYESVERGVEVLMSDLDSGLKGFTDLSFDYVVLEETLQTLRRPVEVLNDMLRVGRVGIVSFPNFGHWRVRAELVATGRMPRTGALPYEWFDTPNIHLCSLADFLAWSRGAGVSVRAGYARVGGEVRALREGDELEAEEVLLVVHRGESGL